MFAGDNVILFGRSMGWRRNERFVAAFRDNARNAQEQALELRLNTLAWAAEQALHVAGDFVECGVFRGFSSAVLCAYLAFARLPRRFWLYDTFAGIPEGFDVEQHNSPTLAEPGLYEKVLERFRPYPNVSVVRGVIPDVFAQAAPERIAFMHIDLNSSKSELAALGALFDRVSTGGVVVFDDYGWAAYVAQQLAEDAWMAARNHRILELPTGQGLLVKHAYSESEMSASI
jgi:predicted O-methyltransferase YrrM